MEVAVERHERVEVLVGTGRTDREHPPGQRVERVEVGVGRVGGRAPGGAGLEGEPDVEDAVEVLAGERHHAGAPVGGTSTRPSAASRPSASRTGVRETPEPLGELDLAQVGARGEFAAQDRLAQRGVGALGRASRRRIATRVMAPSRTLYAT